MTQSKACSFGKSFASVLHQKDTKYETLYLFVMSSIYLAADEPSVDCRS